MKKETKYVVYILECSNGSFYTGYTIDMERRFQEHLDGSSKCKYTRSFPPIGIAACWYLEEVSLSLALKVEKNIKALPRKDKLKLIANPDTLSQICAEEFVYTILLRGK